MFRQAVIGAARFIPLASCFAIRRQRANRVAALVDSLPTEIEVSIQPNGDAVVEGNERAIVGNRLGTTAERDDSRLAAR